ncbi:hypothetical protein [Riemerella columbipharyngis]|uniref:Terminase n=1 Tax=Riemerella columbipharyngis TaxID=1071918 RepID=A0A1G7FLQ3_9FLAO|nr:hypothetical protein [Riemerella columbipharyngis]SDE76800.1 hypothetical protein SAMN05421544_12410 [Riemerella columbipharyngis]
MTKTELKEAKERYFLNSKMIKELTSRTLTKETDDEQQTRIKRLLKPENYNAFFDYYFGAESGLPLADAPCAPFHQESYSKVFKDRFIRQLRMWYRGAAKSIHTNVGNILHLKENNELFFALLIGANEGLAKLLLSDLQVQLESNERLIKDFGVQVSYGDWADGEFQTKDGKFFKALGLNQPFRGLRFGAFRPDFASIDDCEDRDRAKRPEMVRKYGEKITGDLKKAFHKQRGRFIVPNNYIVKGGLIDFIKDKFKDSKHLDISRVDLATKNITRDNCQEVKDWEPSWKERYTKQEVINIIMDDDYYTSQREDFNNPIEEGKLFKTAQIIKRKVHYSEAWDGFIVHWDLSYTSNGDYKAGVLIGVQGVRLTVLEIFCQRCSTNAAMDAHFAWIMKYKAKGYTPLSFYDATAAQQVVYEPVILQTAEDNNCTDIPIPMHQQGDKHNRIEATLLNVFNRKILFWDETLSGKDYEAFMNQVLSFEKGTTANDDAPDTLERAVFYCQRYYGFTAPEKGSGKPLIGKRRRASAGRL